MRNLSVRTNKGARAAVLASFVLLLLATACSHKSPVGVEDPGEPGEPELFFNWLPALLVDQESAQPMHELMQWLDDQSNYPDRSRTTELRALLERLGDSPQEYRAHADGYQPADEPILDAIQVYIEQARAYLDENYQYEPLLQRSTG